MTSSCIASAQRSLPSTDSCQLWWLIKCFWRMSCFFLNSWFNYMTEEKTQSTVVIRVLVWVTSHSLHSIFSTQFNRIHSGDQLLNGASSSAAAPPFPCSLFTAAAFNRSCCDWCESGQMNISFCLAGKELCFVELCLFSRRLQPSMAERRECQLSDSSRQQRRCQSMDAIAVRRTDDDAL